MGASRPRVLVVGDESKGAVRRVIDDFEPRLRAATELVAIVLDRDAPLDGYEADVCLVFGGDGSLLAAARRMGDVQTPTLGVNLGKLGFLAEVSLAQLDSALEQIVAGELEEEARLLVRCKPPGEDGPGLLFLNDAVVQRRPEQSLLEVTVMVGGDLVTTYAGDGLILATPVGSTAYALSAGGPILAPLVEAFVLCPLAPHTLTVRPLVVPSPAGVWLVVEGNEGEECGSLVVDGQVRRPVRGGDRIEFVPAKRRFRLLRLAGDDFFSILRRKFRWAGAPRYERLDG